ncbi:unnamed protein product [Camellia sinensis]
MAACSLYDLANVVPTLAKFYHQASENYELACTRHISMIIYYQFERLFQFARRIEDFMYTLAPEEMYYNAMRSGEMMFWFGGACFLYFWSDVGAIERGDGGALELGWGSGWEAASQGLGFGSFMLNVVALVGAELACFPVIPFQLGLSKVDLRKVVKSSLSGVSNYIPYSISHLKLQRCFSNANTSVVQVDKSISAMYKKLQKNLTSEELLPSLWDKCKKMKFLLRVEFPKEFLDKYDSFAQLVAKIYPTETIPSVAEMRDLLATM